MTFEKDSFFLGLRFIFLILIVSLILYFFNTLLKNQTSYGLNNDTLLIVIIGSILFILFFLTSTVELKNKSLILTNIYGLKISQYSLEKVKGRKVKYIDNKTSMFVFGKKYNQFISIRFSSTEGDFTLNGYIFSRNGLKQFLRKTKK
ncbi:hypothetical protein ACIVBQ_000515 [Tenacibaculum discolor]